jgi:steroid delta-isomerase-like uncharacterized protein
MTAHENKRLAQEAYDAFNRGAIEYFADHGTADVEVLFVTTGQTFRGREGLRQFAAGFKQAFPDGQIEIQNQVAGDDSVVTEFHFHGTQTGPLPGPGGEIPPTGRSVDYLVCEVWQVRDGKLARAHNY